jgi:hypothetical protein
MTKPSDVAPEERAMAVAHPSDRNVTNERAAFTGQLSLQAFALAQPGVPYEPRVSRFVARVLCG